MEKSLLAIGAHYDDCAFGIPGVLLQAVRKHYRVVVVALIGDYTNWTPVGASRQDAFVEGAREVCARFGAELRFLPYASMRFGVDEESKAALARVVGEVQPDIAFHLWPHDHHPDHEAAAALAKFALRYGDRVIEWRGYRGPRRIYQFDNGPRHTIGFEPDTFVDITPDWERSREWLARLMAVARNQTYDAARRDSAVEAKQALAAYRGKTCGVKYAEAVQAVNAYTVDILG